MTTFPRAVLGVAAFGAAGLGYSLWEAKQFRLRRVDLRVLPPGERPLRVLHLSDLHLTPGQRDKQEWVQRLATLRPDLVVDTGDNLAHPDAVEPALEALGPLLEVPGVFVMGSNDYYAPRLKSPMHYFNPESDRRIHGPELPWRDLRDGFVSAGWTDLDNARATVKVDDRTFDFVGVDDAHLGLDNYDEVSGPADPSASLAIGVTHAPYLRVLDRMADDAFPLVFAGHTHGGQLCLPGIGALVTNCDLPRSQAKGLHRRGEQWLHVSAGLGTSPFTPVRFACPPEASLVTLLPRHT
ncbi:MAG TPA: metallophosphoesterase [Actinomycetes bacterium]|nr:metallophosphoesterase [Actinomycetes bacterium]